MKKTLRDVEAIIGHLRKNPLSTSHHEYFIARVGDLRTGEHLTYEAAHGEALDLIEELDIKGRIRIYKIVRSTIEVTR